MRGGGRRSASVRPFLVLALRPSLELALREDRKRQGRIRPVPIHINRGRTQRQAGRRIRDCATSLPPSPAPIRQVTQPPRRPRLRMRVSLPAASSLQPLSYLSDLLGCYPLLPSSPCTISLCFLQRFACTKCSARGRCKHSFHQSELLSTSLNNCRFLNLSMIIICCLYQ